MYNMQLKSIYASPFTNLCLTIKKTCFALDANLKVANLLTTQLALS